MIRTQIQLTEEQARQLRERARLERRSMADVVRESVADYLAREPRLSREELLERARSIAGTFRSGQSDLAEAHDRHLDEAFDD